MSPLPTGTVTFLFTDIVGSTKLWEQHPQLMPAALARHHTLLRAAIESQSGVLFKTVGDGICAAFANALDAAAAAVTAQRTLVAEAWGLPALRVRMALHTGVVEARDGDYVGQPLNRVARLLVAGHGGQVLLTRATTELVRDHLPPGMGLRDLGEHRLKDLFRPEHVFQLVAPDLAADFPPLRSLDQWKTNLPAQPTPLLGREHEVAAAAAILRRPGTRLLTLTGPGGIGKTRLGLQVAVELLDDFADGVSFVALAAISDPALVPTAIADALGIREAGNQPLSELLTGYLRDKHMLLVLDNVEHLLEASPAIAVLLERASQLKVLVTSRVVTHLYGEHEYVVPPLSLPDLKRLPSLERLTQYEAVGLFIERAHAAKADFAVTNDNAPAIAEICVRLDGLPLAIELAAARSKILSPALLLARLANRLALLTGGPRNLPNRHQTLRSTIDWSYELLEPQEQVLFARLAVFAGGCTVEAASAICNATGDLPLEMLDGLASLVDKSLLRQGAGQDDELRFTMLETIREYALDRLKESGDTKALRQRHATFYLTLAEQANSELMGPQQVAWLVRLEAEHDNMRAVLAWALDQGEIALAARLGSAVRDFWLMRGHLSEGRHWLERTLARREVLAVLLQARALKSAGTLAWAQGDYPQAQALIEASLVLYRELGNKMGIARALCNLGNTLSDQGDYAGSRATYEESLGLARELGDTHDIAQCLTNLGLNALMEGDLAQARTLIEESLTIDRTRGDPWGITNGLSNLGLIALAEGNATQAQQCFAEVRTLNAELGGQTLMAECLAGLAGVATMHGQHVAAARLFGTAEALREAIGAPMQPFERQVYAPYLVTGCTQLGETAFTAAWAEGRTMTPEQANAYALELALQPPAPPPAKSPYPAGLTAREVEVLRLVAQGLTDAQVAAQLVLSPRTINAHLASIYGKLGVNSRTAASRFALDHDLV